MLIRIVTYPTLYIKWLKPQPNPGTMPELNEYNIQFFFQKDNA